jgi:hypothetical protein
MKKPTLALAVILSVAMAGCGGVSKLVRIASRDGIQQGFIHMMPADPPVASVILYAGGSGDLRLSGSATMEWGAANFLVRSRRKFVNHGFQVAVIDTPENRSGHIPLDRSSAEHLADSRAVAAFLRSQADVPVWVVGTSRGSVSVANMAVNGGDAFAGAVFTSSVLQTLHFDLPGVTIPALVLHNTNDGCVASLPHVARLLYDRLENASRRELVWLTSRARKSAECNAKSPHGYLGIEGKAVDAIAAFIKGNGEESIPME